MRHQWTQWVTGGTQSVADRARERGIRVAYAAVRSRCERTGCGLRHGTFTGIEQVVTRDRRRHDAALRHAETTAPVTARAGRVFPRNPRATLTRSLKWRSRRQDAVSKQRLRGGGAI